jgi:PAS domain S-box-containing protein
MEFDSENGQAPEGDSLGFGVSEVMEQSVRPTEDALECLITFLQELSIARGLDEIMAVVRRAVRLLAEADGATLVLREGDQCYYADGDAISPLWKGSRFPMDACISGWVMREGKPAVIEDIYTDGRIPHDLYRPTFVKSLAMAPIRGKAPIGAIGVYWAKQNRPDPKTLKLIRLLAESTAVAIGSIDLLGDLTNTLKATKPTASHGFSSSLPPDKVYADGIDVDIAELKKAAKKLKESEATARALLNIPNAAAFLLDRDGICLDANETLATRFGKTPSEIIGKPIWDLFPTEVAERRKARFIEVLQSKRMDRFEDERDGLWNEIVLSPILDERGEVLKVAVLGLDVTERKQVERALLRSEERLKLALTASRMGVWEWDIRTNDVFWSPECFEVLGEIHFTGTLESFTNILHPEDAGRVMGATYQALAQRTPFSAEFRIVRPDARILWLSNLGQPTYDEAGNPLRLTGTVQDITERKETQDALRDSEERFRKIFEEGPLGMAIVDSNCRFIRTNPAFCRMLGYAEAELSSLAISEIVHPESEGKDLAEKVVRGEAPLFKGEMRFIRKDAEAIWAYLVASPITNEHGAPAYTLAMVEDISERKRAEIALRESDERYHTLFEGNQSVMLLIDPQSANIIDANPAARSYYGYSTQEMINRKITDLNTLPADEVLREMERARLADCGYFLFRHRLSSGEIRDVEVYSSPIRVRGKELLYSIVHDITERKMMESALVRREIELESRSRELEGANTALKMVLKKREENEEELKHTLHSNVKEMILPFIERLRDSHLDETQRTYVNVIERNLQEVYSPFLKQLSSLSPSLSPMDIQVAGLIKEGKSSKEIAKILGVSINTVISYRYRLRTKLGLKNEKINLRSYLSSRKDS